MADSVEKRGFFGMVMGPDSIKKADAFRVIGIWLSCLSALAVLGSALILRDVHALLFVGLGLGGFYTFVAGEMRRRVTIELAFESLRAEVLDLRKTVTRLMAES